MTLSLSFVVAMAENGCIGKAGDLPWHIPQDLRRFKRLTMGHAVLMGRITYESIVARLGGPLPGRESIVLSRSGVSLDVALKGRTGEIFVIGGAQIYALTLPLATKMYLTRIHKAVEGDAFFPHFEENAWEEIEREDYPEFSFVTLVRRSVSMT